MSTISHLQSLKLQGRHDTAMLASHSSLQVAFNAVQEWLHAIERWTAKWNIAINCTKSACVTFTLRPQTCLGILFDGNTIDFVSSHCFLGVHPDRALIWKAHITAVRAKSSRKLKKLEWLFNSIKLHMATKALLIKAILGPTLTYAIQVWGTASRYNRERHDMHLGYPGM